MSYINKRHGGGWRDCRTCQYYHFRNCEKWETRSLPWYVVKLKLLRRPFWCTGWMRDLRILLNP